MKRINCDALKMSVRKVGPTRRSVSGVYAFRGETAVPFESTLERDFVIRTEFSLNVLDIISQPVEIPFEGSNGQTYTYTPDFLVYYHLGDRTYQNYPLPLLVEVKPEAIWKANWQAWKAKWRAAHRFARTQGWEFRIYDETRIRDLAYDNIRFLERYKRMSFSEEESLWILEGIRNMGIAPFHLIMSHHFMGMYRAAGVSHLWHLVATRRLECDISQALNEFTELWVPSHEV